MEGVGSDTWKDSFVSLIDYLANSKIDKKHSVVIDCFMHNYLGQLMKDENEILF